MFHFWLNTFFVNHDCLIDDWDMKPGVGDGDTSSASSASGVGSSESKSSVSSVSVSDSKHSVGSSAATADAPQAAPAAAHKER